MFQKHKKSHLAFHFEIFFHFNIIWFCIIMFLESQMKYSDAPGPNCIFRMLIYKQVGNFQFLLWFRTAVLQYQTGHPEMENWSSAAALLRCKQKPLICTIHCFLFVLAFSLNFSTVSLNGNYPMCLTIINMHLWISVFTLLFWYKVARTEESYSRY